MKKAKLRLSAAVLALIMCLSLLVGCGEGITLKDVEKDPYAAVMSGSEKLMEGLSDKDMVTLAEKLKSGVGTYNIGLSVPETADVDVNAVVDAKNGAYSGKATVGVMGVSTEASVWGDKNNIALSVPALLGEGSYGVKLDTLETDLAASELFSTLTGGMSLDDLKSSLESEMGITWDELKGMVSVDTWKAAFDKYVADSKGYLTGKTATVAEETFKIGENELPVISVQYTFTADDYKKLTDLSVEMIESVCGKALTAAGVDLGELMAEADAEASAEIPEEGIDVKYYLNKKNGALIAADMGSGESVKATLVYGENPAEKLDMTANIAAAVDGEAFEVAMTLKETSAEGKDGFDLDAVVKAAGEEHTVKVACVRNVSDGKYEIKLSADGEEIGGAAGTYTCTADELKLTVDSVTANGETVQIGLTVSAKAGGTVEALPEYTNVLTAPMEEISGLIENISALFAQPDYGYDDSYVENYEGDYYYDDSYGEDYEFDFGDDYYDDSYGEDYEFDFGDEDVDLEGAEV